MFVVWVGQWREGKQPLYLDHNALLNNLTGLPFLKQCILNRQCIYLDGQNIYFIDETPPPLTSPALDTATLNLPSVARDFLDILKQHSGF